jgi:hypothetical protein
MLLHCPVDAWRHAALPEFAIDALRTPFNSMTMPPGNSMNMPPVNSMTMPPGYATFNNDSTRSLTCSTVNGLRM